MSSTTLQRDDLIPQSPDGTGKGLALALLVHALLIAAIAVSVNWRSSTPAGVEAELWAAVPQIAAPRPTAPEPAPTPAPPQPKPPEPPPRAEPAPQVVADAQIAIEKAKREEAKRKEEALRREELQKREEAKRDEAKQEAKREEAQRLKEEQERKKKELAEQKRKEAAQAAAEAEQREKQMQRIAGLAGATGEPNSTGTAQRTAGPSASYAGRIKARILPHITFPDSVEGNPLATVEVRAAPDGTIIGRRLLKSSGVKAWDDAVLRAIDKTEVLPRDTDGRVPSSFEIAFRVRE